MSFVRTPDEVTRIRESMAHNRFSDIRSVSVWYRTAPAVVERLLPPGLEPTGEPTVEVTVHTIGTSNCVGGFAGGALYLAACHGDREGKYCLTMPMSTDAAIIWGRELFGEPKKAAACTLDRQGSVVRGTVDRYGERLVDLEATMEREHDPREGTETVFHYKALPAVDGDGFHGPVTLVAAELTSSLSHLETGSATLSLSSTRYDPLAEVEVRSIERASYVEGSITTRQEELTTVDAEAYAPYAFGAGRMDDPLALADADGLSGLDGHAFAEE